MSWLAWGWGSWGWLGYDNKMLGLRLLGYKYDADADITPCAKPNWRIGRNKL